ncbi:MAG TPA: HoxN/HupN/NixA family nickel/cobalt transporter [Novosphingobium sp.]|nr:HoxN/HupN/NixA family nickel/cobalt transporter [Novosphingobium sp.]HZV11331.1 HoxN/HupN/NixA family nickel/cobalt transporter [Novosphingobium sp.]
MPSHTARPLRQRIIALYLLLGAANIAVWLWAYAVLRGHPALIGTAFLAYSFGLRHAVDADHIAAIDNVTRKLMQEGQRPLGTGFFFAIGHSAVVLVVTLLIARTASAASGIEALKAAGGVISTCVSAFFLFAIAAMNLVILRSVYRSYRQVLAGGVYVEEDLDMLLAGRGLMARLLRPLFALIRRSWHMAPLGFLFGLGFDTATEVGLMGLAAVQAAQGLSLGVVLLFPALFAAGMALVDTTDGIMMLGAYEWAFVKPIRKLYYNMTITLVAALVAILIGGIETLALIAHQWNLQGALWDGLRDLAGQFGLLGFAIVGLFALSWALSWLLYRRKGLDHIEVIRAG